jgi:nitrogen regulatory protein P-II 1
MKNLVMIAHANIQQDLSDLLRSLERVKGFTFAHVEGHGVHVEHDPFLSTRDKVVGYTPRIRVDVLLEDEYVDEVINEVRNEKNNIAGNGIFWVTNVQQHGRL